MNIWKILGIDQTTDKKAIKDAYIERLHCVNPEDDPEGFMELRNAYDEANAFAGGARRENTQKLIFDDTPMGEFLKSAYECYSDFSKRIDAEKWKELLASDIVFSLETGEEAMDALFELLIKRHFLPHDVWKIICDTFEVEARKDELSKTYPSDFLEYAINNSRYKDNINYRHFDDYTHPSEEYDKYIEGYIQLLNAIFCSDIPKADELLEELDDMPLKNQDLEILRAKLVALKGDGEYACVILEELLEEYPDNFAAKLSLAMGYQKINKTDMAQKLFGEILEIDANTEAAKVGIAMCDMANGNFRGAKESLRKLLNDNRFDDFLHAKMIECNSHLMEEFEKGYAQKTLDDEDTVEYAWCCYQNGLFDKATQILMSVNPVGILSIDRAYLLGRCVLQSGKPDETIDYLNYWLDNYDAYRDYPGMPGDRNRDRESLVYFFLSEAYAQKGDYERALLENEKGLEKVARDTGMMLNQRAVLFNHLGRYEEAIEACDDSIRHEHENYEALGTKADALCAMGRYEEALREYGAASYLNPFFTKVYACQMRIFMDFGAMDNAKYVYDSFKKLKMDSVWVSHVYVEYLLKKNEDDAAYAALGELVKNIMDDTVFIDEESYWLLYADMGQYLLEQGDVENALFWTQKGFEGSMEKFECLMVMGEIYEKKGDKDKATEYYERASIADPGRKKQALDRIKALNKKKKNVKKGQKKGE